MTAAKKRFLVFGLMALAILLVSLLDNPSLTVNDNIDSSLY